MNEVLFAVFLVVIGIAAAQTPPPDQARQIELQKEAMRKAAPFKIIGWPTLTPAGPIRILPTLKKIDNK